MIYEEMKNQIVDIESKKILTFKEAAAYLGISPSALYKFNHKRIIAFSKPNNKFVYYKKNDLDAFMLSNYHPSIAEVENEIINNLNILK